MTKLGLWLILTIFTLCALLTPARPIGAEDTDEVVARLERGISWLLRRAPNRPLAQDVERRLEFARAIVDVSREWGHDPFLIASVAFFESSFRPHVIGRVGERGIMQVHGPPARSCDFDTVRGQLRCGARYLRIRTDQCGSVRGGLTAYLSGVCWAVPWESVWRDVSRRLRMARSLKMVE